MQRLPVPGACRCTETNQLMVLRRGIRAQVCTWHRPLDPVVGAAKTLQTATARKHCSSDSFKDGHDLFSQRCYCLSHMQNIVLMYTTCSEFLVKLTDINAAETWTGYSEGVCFQQGAAVTLWIQRRHSWCELGATSSKRSALWGCVRTQKQPAEQPDSIKKHTHCNKEVETVGNLWQLVFLDNENL